MAKQFGGQNNNAQQINLESMACVETTLSNNAIVVNGNTEIASASLDSAGKLTLTFADGAMLIVRDYTSAKAGQIQMANGKVLPVETALADGQTLAATETAAGNEAGETHVIGMPAANQKEVVTLEAGDSYHFDFSMTDPVSAKVEGGALVVSFKDGGQIIIPNYSEMTAAGTDTQIVLADGAELNVADIYDTLAAAAQLNAVETAAGDGAGGGSAGGFGFQSVFSATTLEGLNAIGAIGATELQYQTFNEQPLDVANSLNNGAPILPVISLNVSDSAGLENESGIPLNVSTGAVGANEQTTVTISGIPSTWGVDTSVSGGTYNPATGTWTITLPAGQGLTHAPTLTPPAYSDVDLNGVNVSVTVTDLNTGVSNTTSNTVNVVVDAVAQGVIVGVTTDMGVGDEDTAIPVNMAIGTIDPDGSEQVTSIVISNVPAGWTFNHGQLQADGTWVMTHADMSTLTITPPHNYSGPGPQIIVSITTTEVSPHGGETDLSNNSVTVDIPVNITVNEVADAPTLTIGNTEIYEDQSGYMNIHATLNDPSESLTVTISGFQPGWTVNANGGTYDAATGTWTITLPAGVNFDPSMGPIVQGPANSDVDLTGLSVTATSTTAGINGGHYTATTHGTADIVVDAVADGATVTVQDPPLQAWYYYNTSYHVPLNITAVLNDTDGSEIITTVTIDLNNLFTGPNGPYNTLESMGIGLNMGTEVSPGVWVITVNSTDASTALAGLQLVVPPGFDYTVIHQTVTGWHASTIGVTVQTAEVNTHGGEFDHTNDTASSHANINMTFYITPLVLDLDGDGITLVGQNAGVHFDMNNDGIADSTTWVGGNDGFLALDLNGDGIINNQSELFGNSATAMNGFANLASYDENGDGVIDANDSIFSQLVVWQDSNMDGISQADEMHSLSYFNIASINLNAVASNQQIADGGLLATSTFTYTNGQTGVIGDALFNVTNGKPMDIKDVLTPHDDLLFADSVHAHAIQAPANQNLAYDSTSIDIDALTNVATVP